MKIAIVTSGGLPVPNVKGGGAQTLITAILDQNEIKGENEFVVFSSYDNKAKEQSEKYKKSRFYFLPQKERTLKDKIKGKIMKEYPLESPISFTSIAKIIKKEKCDKVIVEHTPWQFPFFVKKFGTKAYCHLHNDWLNSDSDRKYINQMRKAINQSGGMITVSDYIKTRVLSIGGLNQEKVKTLYNATDIDMFSKKISNSEQIFLKNQLGIAENSIVILYSGRMCDEKGVLELIKAFVEVIEKNNDAVLLLVGSVSYGETTSDEYTKTIATYMAEYPKKIIETGFVDYKDMYKYYSIADMQVIPSKWDEPFGLVAIEGMAQGIPIISTNSGGLVEILNNKYAMVINRENEIYELKRAMLWLVEDSQKRLELGQNAKEELEKHNEFSYKEYYNRFLEIID